MNDKLGDPGSGKVPPGSGDESPENWRHPRRGEYRDLAMACRSALDISRQADIRPDPAVQAYLRMVTQARRPAARAVGLFHPRAMIGQTLVGLAAVLLIFFLPDRLMPTAEHLPLELLAECQTVSAPIDAYAGLYRRGALGGRELRAVRTEGGLAARRLVPIPSQPDSN
jgi:hypothetical protein